MAQQAFYTKINAGAGVQFSGGTIAQATGVLHTNNVLYLRGGSGGLFLQNADGTDGIYIANDRVQIETSATQRLRVTSGGNVAIGPDTSPNFKLDIGGDVRIQGTNKLRFGGTGSQDMNFGLTIGPGGGPSAKFIIENPQSSTPYLTISHGSSVNGQVRFDSYGSGSFTGTAAYNLQVDSSGNIIETAAGGSGTVTGNGTATYLPIWTSGSALGNSIVSSSAGDITINGSDNDPRVYINPLGGDIGDSALIQFNSRGHVGYTSSLIELGDNGQSKNVRLRVNTADIIFQTSNTTRMNIKTDGKIGIGTTTPATLLEVSSASSPNLRLHNTTSNGANSGTLEFREGDTNYGAFVRYNGDANIFQLGTRSGGTDYARMTILRDSGYIGVNTTSPPQLLTISGDANYIAHYDGSNYAFMLGADSSGDGNFELFNSSGTKVIKIYAEANSSSYINNGGNFGIGTASPTALLDVGGGDGTPAGTQFSAVIKGTSARALYLDGDTSNAASMWWGKGNTPQFAIDSMNNGGANFWTYNGGWSRRMDITNTGDVGIGTSTPDEKLSVVGNIRANVSNSGGFMLTGSSASGLVRNNATGLALRTNTTDRLIIPASGYVGIGIASPAYELDVNGDIGTTRYIRHGGDSNTYFGFSGDDVIQFNVGGDEELYIKAAGSSTNYPANIVYTDHNFQVGLDGGKHIGNRINYCTSQGWTEDAAPTANQDGYYGGNFNLNGASTENQLAWGKNPWGARALIWTSINDSSSNADGGWGKNIANLPGDDYAYMSIVYVKKNGTETSNTGSFYHGCSGSHTLNLDGNANTNPYFQSTSANNLPDDVWCVSIGIIQANSDANTSISGLIGGIYRLDTGQKVQNATTFKMKSGSTAQTHRTYLYYSTNTNNNLSWYAPGFYVVDGTEPTLAELVYATNATNGSGTTGYIPKWQDANTLTDSKLSEQASSITSEVPIKILDSLAANNPMLTLYNDTNGAGSSIWFSDQATSSAQKGYLTFYHSDGSSQGGGATFQFLSTETDMTLQVGGSAKAARIVVWSANSQTEVDYGFADDVNTGMTRIGADQVALIAGGVQGVYATATSVAIKNAGNTRLLTTGGGVDITGALAVGNINMTGALSIDATYPRINLTDTNHDDDWSIINDDGEFGIYNATDSSYALKFSGANYATFANGISATNTSFNGTMNISGGIYHIGDTNTFFGFVTGDDTFGVTTGGGSRMDANDAGVRFGGANARITTILDDDAMTSDSNVALATQQSIKAYVDNSISGATLYKGTWDPSSGTYGSPDLSTASLQVNGQYYICSANGSATPNGAGTEPDSWHVGDWVIWNDDLGSSGLWQKIDNTSVISGAGTANKAVKWSDTETLANAPITFSGDNSVFAGHIEIVNILHIDSVATGNPYIDWRQGGSQKAYIQYADTGDVFDLSSDGQMRFKTNGENVALTIDTSQDALFASDVAITAKLAVGATSVHASYDLYNQGTFYSNGAATINANLTVDAGSISISGDGANFATLTESGSGDFTIAALDDIRLDSGGNDIVLRGASSSEFGRLTNNSQTFIIKNITEDKDIRFDGNDGNGTSGTNITALRLDMSDAGWAHFNAGLTVGAGTSTFAGDVVLSSADPYLKIEAKNANSFVDPYLEFTTWNVASGASAGKIALTNGSWNNNDMAFFTETSNSVTEKMRILSTGQIKMNLYGSQTFSGTAAFNLSVDSNGNIIETSNAITGGPYLALSGGTMTGHTLHGDNVMDRYGSSNEFSIYHNGTNGFLQCEVGNLNLVGPGELTVGSSGTGRDVVFHGDLAGEYFHWDENVSTVNIYHRDELPGLEVYVNGAEQTTQPQFKVGRSNTQYWGAYVDDRNAHLVHRQDETSGTMTTRFDQWDSNTSDLDGEWLWRSGNGTGGSMTNALTLTQAGNATFAGNVVIGTVDTVTTGLSIGEASPTIQLFDTTNDAKLLMYTQDNSSIIGTYSNHPLAFYTDSGLTLTLNTDHSATFAGTGEFEGNVIINTPSANSDSQGLTINRPAAGTHYASVEFATNGTVDWSVGTNSTDAFEIYENGQAATTRLSIAEGGNATFAGDISIPVAKKLYFGGGSHTYIGEDIDDRLRFFVGGAEFLRFTEDTADTIFICQNAKPLSDSTIDLGSTTLRYANIWVDNINGGTPTTGGPYLPLAGGAMTGNLRLNDNVNLYIGSQTDLVLAHNGSNSYISNYVGDLYIEQTTNDGNIYFKCDDGLGGLTEYFRVDGGESNTIFSRNLKFLDSGLPSRKLIFGTGNDFQIYHDGSNSYITNATGDLYIQGNGDDVVIQGADDVQIKVQGGEVAANFGGNGGVDLYHNNVRVFSTGSTGITVQGNSNDITFVNDSSTDHNYLKVFVPDTTVNALGVSQTNVYIPLALEVDGVVTLNNNLQLQDSDSLQLGNSQDLEIYHASGNSNIDNKVGHLYIRANVGSDTGSNIYIQAKSGENSIICNDDGSVNLYYNNSAKLYTHGSGVGAAGYYGFGSAGTSTGSSYYFRYGSSSAGATQGMIISTSDTGGSYFDGVAQFRNTNTGQGANMFQMINYGALYGRYINFYRGSTSNIIGYIGYNSSNTAVTYSTSSSDIRLKKNIVGWDEDVLPKFLALTPKKFDFKAAIGDKGADKVKGFIAQYETKNFPEVYQLNGEGQDARYGFHPMEMVPYLMKAVKELAEKNEDLERRLAALEK